MENTTLKKELQNSPPLKVEGPLASVLLDHIKEYYPIKHTNGQNFQETSPEDSR